MREHYGKCAQCDEDAAHDNPRLCPKHTLVFYAMLGSMWQNEMREVHICPFKDWSVLHNGLDLEGLENVIRDHLDTCHPGWTMEQIEDIMKDFVY